MGVDIADSDSELLDEKAQPATAHKRSRCPWNLLVQILRGHQGKREQKDRSRIEEIRVEINNDREPVKTRYVSPWQGTTSTEQRRSIWEGLLDSSSLEHDFTFSTSQTYKVTTSSKNAGWERTVIHDFRTPEGREEAFKWWDAEYQRYDRDAVRILEFYDLWESVYQEYVKYPRSHDRKVLLRGIPPITWCDIEIKKLPN